MNEKAKEMLLHYSLTNNGDWHKIFHSIQTREEISNPLTCEDKYITILDKEIYDERIIKTIQQPPFVLFYEGNLDLIKDISNNVAVSSTRELAQEKTDLLVESLLNDESTYVVASGHRSNNVLINSIMLANPKVIVVLSTSLAEFKKQHLDMFNKIINNGGLVITEYPTGAKEDTTACMARYRIVNALSQKTVILRSRKRCGNNLLVSFALSSGKDVFVVPTSIFDKDCSNNELILEGAIPLIYRGQVSFAC